MAAQSFPVEIVDKILREVVQTLGHKVTSALIALSELNKTWAFLSRHFLFQSLVLASEKRILELPPLVTAPHSTFPARIKPQVVVFKSPGLGTAGTSALQEIVKLVATPGDLEICTIDGGISQKIVDVFSHWTDLKHLIVSGGIHTPSIFFDQLKAFRQVEWLSLHQVQLNVTNEHPPGLFSFPPNIARLSLSQSSAMWTFLGAHVIQGGGFGGIRELCIKAQFCLQAPGTSDMLACLRQLRTLHALELEPICQRNCRSLKPSLKYIFESLEMPLLRIRGLKRFHLNFAQVPADIALGFLVMSTIHLPCINTDMAVDIRLPQSSTLWDDNNPQDQLRLLLAETRPNNTPDLEHRSSITVRGFPGTLPEHVVEMGARICGYLVAFVGPEDTITRA